MVKRDWKMSVNEYFKFSLAKEEEVKKFKGEQLEAFERFQKWVKASKEMGRMRVVGE